MASRTRVILNRRKAQECRLALADGVFQVAVAIVERAHPPDATPYGVGLIHNGGALGYLDGKQIGVMSLDSAAPSKPRAAKLLRPGMTAIAGYGFPGRFQEEGTIHQPARPFLTPAGSEVFHLGPVIMAAAVRRAIGSRP